MLQTKCLILIPVFTRQRGAVRSVDGAVEEAAGLARAINLEVCEVVTVRLSEARPATLIGSGKIEEIKAQAASQEIALVIVDGKLSPIQQRNLEKHLGCKVIDRTALILEIFGARAFTREGKLQVELAALNYQKSRLVRTWTHLERQRGGFGFLGGPGETQLEVDKRIIRDRIRVIESALETVVKTRTLHRKRRKRNNTPVIALVGYTNAGKSTLFNRLTGAGVVAENKLFATLDPTLRSIKLPSGGEAIISDTVGFVSNLPTELVAAFRATLEEVIEADLIIHVRDISHQETEEQRRDVISVLASLGLEDKIKTSMLEVLNKSDLLAHELPPLVDGIAISALTGDGVDRLLEVVGRKLSGVLHKVEVKVDCTDGKAIAFVESHAQIIRKEQHEEVTIYAIVVDEVALGALKKMQSIEIIEEIRR